MIKKNRQYLLIFIYTAIICVIAVEITLRTTGTYDSYTEKYGKEYLSPYDDVYMWPVYKRKNGSQLIKSAEFEHINQHRFSR